MAMVKIRVRTLDQIIKSDLDASQYKTKRALNADAREIREREVNARKEQRDEEQRMREQERKDKQEHDRLANNIPAGSQISRHKRQQLLRSGTFVEHRGMSSCKGTGYLKDSNGYRTLPCAKCRGTGMIKVKRYKRRRNQKKYFKKKFKGLF